MQNTAKNELKEEKTRFFIPTEDSKILRFIRIIWIYFIKNTKIISEIIIRFSLYKLDINSYDMDLNISNNIKSAVKKCTF